MTRLLALTLALATLPAPASAFCGFFVSGADAALYNDASQVVLMRQGNRTVMTMSNTYKGPPEDFAMVVPVPVVLQEEQVRTLPHDVFDKIDQLSAPRLVEYWEQDPCYLPPPPVLGRMRAPMPKRKTVESASPAPDDLGVTVEAEFTVGEYNIVILSAEEANGLDTWLRRNDYTIPAGAPKALAPYIAEGMKFFVAKVDIGKVQRDADGRAVLSPLRFDYEADRLKLPVRLGLLNADGKQDLIVYILSPESRYEVANYKNVFIPSNLEVEDSVRKGFGAFYTALFDETMARAGGGAVITEYAWQTTSCDPCPVPPLQPSDMLTLGGDVLGLGGAPGKIPAARRNPRSRRPQPFFGNFSSWTLTRLHTRYSKETLSEDLVFVPAKPVTGGRGQGGINQEVPGGVEDATVNNFQGRYIIRHYWAGPVECKNPQFGRWGGPPNQSAPKPIAAGDLGTTKREAVALKKVVRSNLPQLDLPGKAPPNADKRGK